MANTFQFKLLTPYQSLFEGSVEAVMLPGEGGEFGVLSNHTKFVTALQPGMVRFVKGGRTERFAVSGGFAEVHPEGVVVLADSAESPDRIDLTRAQESLERARAELDEIDPADVARRARVEARLARAQNRIRAGRS